MPADSRFGSFAPDFRVGDWLVEPSLDRLSRNGTVLRLRPQLTNLLVLLAEHGGRTVSKDEILARVWEGQFVAESGMTRCIAELRQALGDDAREPKLLETIPKRGYRLLAPVVFLDVPAQAGPPAASSSSVPPATAASPAPSAEASPGAGMPASPAGPHAEGASAAAEPERQGLQPAGRVPPAAAIPAAVRALLAVIVLLALVWGVLGSSRPPLIGARDTVLLADLRNETGDSAFDRTLRLALAVQLGQAPFLHILPPENARAALSMMGRPHDQPVVGDVALEVCRREGAAVLIAGSIVRLGSHYALGLEAISCRDGDPVARELLEVDRKDDVLGALGTAAGRLRRKLGESRASLRQYDVPIVRATTPSLDALRALSLGDFNRDHARLEDALTFYRRATELDPKFAVAWARRGVAARNLGSFEPDARFGGFSEPMYSFRQAYELRDRVSEPERFYIDAHYYRFVDGDPGKAAETYGIWRRTYPGASVPTLNLASLYTTFGRYDEALPLAREAVRSYPYSSIAASALVVALLGTGQMAGAKEALREASNHGVGDALWHELAYLVAAAEGDDAAMLEQAEWASRNLPGAMRIVMFRSLRTAAAGRLRESRRLWAELAAAAELASGPRGRAGVEILRAETEALVGDPMAARGAASRALAIDREPGTLLGAAIVLGLTGDHARARSLVDEAGGRDESTIGESFLWRPVARALVEAVPGHYDEALAILGETARYERSRDFGLAPLGIRASLELSAGRAEQAAALFQEVLDLRAIAATSPWLAFARVGLARALRDAGKSGESLAAYDAALASMKDADADAPLLLAASRERSALGTGAPGN